jgi:hypothetical protein
MKIRKKRRADYPRVYCCIPGCKASTTRIAPPCESMICYKCWKRAPKRLRDFYSKMRSRLTRAQNRNSPDVARFDHLVDVAFRRVWDSLLEEPVDGEMPETLVEDLRKVGLP